MLTTKVKAATDGTENGFVNRKFIGTDNSLPTSSPQGKKCPRCARAVKVPWLLAILYAPSQPVNIVAFCAGCAGDLRYASPLRQRAICDEIANQISAERGVA